MHKVKEFPNGYKLVALEYGDESPMQGHLGGEMVVDEKSKTIFGWDTFIVVYGLDSVVKACNDYFELAKT